MCAVRRKIGVGPLEVGICADRQLGHGEGMGQYTFGADSCNCPVAVEDRVSGVDDAHTIRAYEQLVNYINSASGELFSDVASEANIQAKTLSGQASWTDAGDFCSECVPFHYICTFQLTICALRSWAARQPGQTVSPRPVAQLIEYRWFFDEAGMRRWWMDTKAPSAMSTVSVASIGAR
jgi:hypothetical protein